MDHRLPIRRTPKRYYFALVVHLVLTVICATWLIPTFYEASFTSYTHDLEANSPLATNQANYIKKHLSKPFEGYEKHQILHPHFGVIALSHMASGMMNMVQNDPPIAKHYKTTMDLLVKRALHPKISPYKDQKLADVKDMGDHNLYLSHLNLILGIHRHITQDKQYDALHDRISKHLVQVSMAEGDAHARSYPVKPEILKKRPNAHKWSADQSVTLASLYLYDQTRKKRLSTRPINAWKKFMQRHRHKTTKLPLPTLDTKSSYAKLPRGCALSWTILYMAQFAPKEASALYKIYRKHHGDQLRGFGIGGFREWPEGISRGMDTDSGPILFGIGAAATGLGLAPARMMRDREMVVLIERTATIVGLPLVVGSRRQYVTAPILGEAILFNGHTARRWFGKQLKSEPIEPTVMPGAAYILLFFSGIFLLYNIMGVREAFYHIRSLR